MKTFAAIAFVCFVAISSVGMAVDPCPEFGLFWSETPGEVSARETCRDHLPHQYPMQVIDCGPAVLLQAVEIEVKGHVIKLNAAEADELMQTLDRLFGYPPV